MPAVHPWGEPRHEPGSFHRGLTRSFEGGSSWGEEEALAIDPGGYIDMQQDGEERWLVRVRGRVQGIGYRDACVRRARALGITGWVRNRMDDSVELTLQGSPQQLADMRRWLRDGVPAARVDELVVTQLQPPFPRFDHFERLPTL